MQSVSSRILTRVAVSISYDDNHYTAELHFLMIYNPHLAQSAVTVEYIDCISAEG